MAYIANDLVSEQRNSQSMRTDQGPSTGTHQSVRPPDGPLRSHGVRRDPAARRDGTVSSSTLERAWHSDGTVGVPGTFQCRGPGPCNTNVIRRQWRSRWHGHGSVDASLNALGRGPRSGAPPPLNWDSPCRLGVSAAGPGPGLRLP